MVVLDFMDVNDDRKECGVRMIFLRTFEYL